MADELRAELTGNAEVVGDIIRTTLGPFGATKLVVDTHGNVTTSAIGSTVIESIDIHDPAVSIMQTAANDFEDHYGDGTSTVVALAGAFLTATADLADQGLHPTTIERGYRDALSIATEILTQKARPLSDTGVKSVATTALTGTRDPHARATVSDYLDQMVTTLGREQFDHHRIKVATRIGGGQGETELVNGIVLEKEPVIEDMPRSLENVGIALLSATVDVPRLGGDTGALTADNIDIVMNDANFEDRVELGTRERSDFRDTLDEITNANCRVIATGRAINDRVKRDIANAGILGIQRVEREDLERLATVTNARVVDSIEHISDETLGKGDVVVRRETGRDMIVFESTAGTECYTLFCRAPDPRSMTAFQRSVESALAAVDHALDDGTVVPGGGAIEMAISHGLRNHAHSIQGPEQLAIEAYADAVRVIPQTLAANAGLDGWDAVLRLHVAHSEARETMGVDCLTGDIVDVLGIDDPLVEPVGLKQTVFEGATDLVIKLIRIDERLPATELYPDPDYAEDDRATPEQD